MASGSSGLIAVSREENTESNRGSFGNPRTSREDRIDDSADQIRRPKPFHMIFCFCYDAVCNDTNKTPMIYTALLSLQKFNTYKLYRIIEHKLVNKNLIFIFISNIAVRCTYNRY